MTQHVHHDLIVQWVKDTTQVVEYEVINSGWFIAPNPSWHPNVKFRIRHKHQDLIDQKAAQPELIVEYKNTRTDAWHQTAGPDNWFPDVEYRLVERRHKHQDLIDQKAARPELIVECKFPDMSYWTAAHTPSWADDIEYRLVEPRHKHQDLIDQKAARPELIVEFRFPGGYWSTAKEAGWADSLEYRLVEPPKTVEMWQWVIQHEGQAPVMTAGFFKTGEEFIRSLPGYKVIQRADWTRIEVPA